MTNLLSLDNMTRETLQTVLIEIKEEVQKIVVILESNKKITKAPLAWAGCIE